MAVSPNASKMGIEPDIVWRVLNRKTLGGRAHSSFTCPIPDNLRPRSRCRRTRRVDEASTLATLPEIWDNNLVTEEQWLHIDSD
jgi:hypothetical protein